MSTHDNIVYVRICAAEIHTGYIKIPDLDDFSESSSTSNLADDHRTISKFISDVVITIKAQEYAKNYDLLTTLPMRNLGERLTAELMQQSDGYLIFLDMDNLKKINDIHGHKAGDRALYSGSVVKTKI